jgi:endoribonuclease Dicer
VSTEPSWIWQLGTPNEEILDKYIVDPMNGGRRFYSERVATHLTPQDPVPAHIPRQNQKFMDTILDYSDSKWLRSRNIDKWHKNQPVLEVEKIPFRRNHLAHVEDKETEVLGNLKTVICPEPMRISNVSIKVFNPNYRTG